MGTTGTGRIDWSRLPGNWVDKVMHKTFTVDVARGALFRVYDSSQRITIASHVCAVAQYTVFEANGKVNGIVEISHPFPPKPLHQFGCRFKYIATSPRESMCKIWVISIRPLPPCACVRKHGFAWVFTARRNARIASAVLAMTFPSVCPSVCHTPVLC